MQGLIRGTKPVLLFIRPLGQPYLFCGRLALVAHDAAVRPMRFLWQLVDVDAVRTGPEGAAFQALAR